jgi:hypothetical protein
MIYVVVIILIFIIPFSLTIYYRNQDEVIPLIVVSVIWGISSFVLSRYVVILASNDYDFLGIYILPIILIISIIELRLKGISKNTKLNTLSYLVNSGYSEKRLDIIARSALTVKQGYNGSYFQLKVNASDMVEFNDYYFLPHIQKVMNKVSPITRHMSVKVVARNFDKQYSSEFDYNKLNNKMDLNNTLKLGVQVYGMTILAAIAFHYFQINYWYLVLVFTISVLMITVFGAIYLRSTDKLTEKSFMELMLVVLKRIPGFSLILNR